MPLGRYQRLGERKETDPKPEGGLLSSEAAKADGREPPSGLRGRPASAHAGRSIPRGSFAGFRYSTEVGPSPSI